MKYLDIQKLTDPQFKRLTGVSWSTYRMMIDLMYSIFIYHQQGDPLNYP